MYTVATIIQCHGLHLHTHSLSMCREGIHWSINGTGIMEMELELFFFSLARFGFPKKSDEKQRINKIHPK